MELRQKKIKFENIFYQMFPKVRTFAFNILKSEADAEDLAQEVFVKLWDMPELWEEADTWKGYIYPMTRNMIFNILKHKEVEHKYIQDCNEISYEQVIDDIHDEIYAKEINLLIKMTINQMPPQRKRAFLLSRKEGWSNAKIAEAMNLSVRTVERHIHLALSELKKVILFAILMNL